MLSPGSPSREALLNAWMRTSGPRHVLGTFAPLVSHQPLPFAPPAPQRRKHPPNGEQHCTC